MAKTSSEELSRNAETQLLAIILGKILFISPFLECLKWKSEPSSLFQLACTGRGSILQVYIHGRLGRTHNCILSYLALGLLVVWWFLWHNIGLFCLGWLGILCNGICSRFLQCQALASFVCHVWKAWLMIGASVFKFLNTEILECLKWNELVCDMI